MRLETYQLPLLLLLADVRFAVDGTRLHTVVVAVGKSCEIVALRDNL